MANFYLIDQSFREEGSHHADYVQCVAEAACRAGFQVIIGANRRLQSKATTDLGDLQQLGAVRATFHNTIYQRCSDLAGLQRMKRRRDNSKSNRQMAWATWFANFQAYRRRKQQESVIHQFSRDCGRFFHRETFAADDHIFFASISDLELVGLSRFLTQHSQTLRAQWHVQFHFNLLNGRPPEYDQQSETLQRVRKRLEAAVAPLTYHNLNLYTTTLELTEQFNQLGIGHFETLAYPIASEFATTSNRRLAFVSQSNSLGLRLSVDGAGSISSTTLQRVVRNSSNITEGESEFEQASDLRETNYETDHSAHLFILPKDTEPSRSLDRPIRIVCPGAIRREKGQGEYLPELITQLQSHPPAGQRIQWVVQRPEKKLGEREKFVIPAAGHAPDCPIVDILPHPMPKADYVHLIRNADVGLLYYDADTYYSRRAGILGELLSAGKPVIVPAGCWLAEQLAEPIFCHVESHFSCRDHRLLTLTDLHWDSSNAPLHGGIINFDGGRRPFHFETELDEKDSTIAIRFDWHWPAEPGLYCRVQWEQCDHQGSVLDRGAQVLGHRLTRIAERSKPRKPIAMIPVRDGAACIKFQLQNAYHNSSANIRNLELLVTSSLKTSDNEGSTPVQQSGQDHSAVPLGAVGVIVPDRESLAASVRELLNHYDHYRDTAQNFSKQWYREHSPARTVQQLLASDQLASEVA